jgi:hypothetical protein
MAASTPELGFHGRGKSMLKTEGYDQFIDGLAKTIAASLHAISQRTTI